MKNYSLPRIVPYTLPSYNPVDATPSYGDTQRLLIPNFVSALNTPSGMKYVSVVGDSGVVGYGAGGDGSTYYTESFAGLMKAAFNSKAGLDNAGLGFINCYTPWDGGQPFTFSSGWVDALTSGYGYGVASTCKVTATDGKTISGSFAGTGAIFSFVTASGSGQVGKVTISIDGGGATLYDLDAMNFDACGEITITGLSDASHTFVITTAQTGGAKLVLFIGVTPTKGTTGFRVQQCGLGGTHSTVLSAPNALVAEITTWEPILTIIATSYNDWNGNMALATYSTNIQAMITEAKKFGDVLLFTYGNTDTANGNGDKWVAYANILQTLAASNSCAYTAVTETLVQLQALNYIAADNLHFNTAGYAYAYSKLDAILKIS